MKVLLVTVCVFLLLQLHVLGQNNTIDQDPYSSYDDEPITNTMNDTTTNEPSTHNWKSDILVEENTCSEGAWSVVDESICAGTNFLSCMPDWTGIIHFKDLTPEGSQPLTVQFTLYGSFGCGQKDGHVQYTLNGNNTQNSRFIYRSNFGCGCQEDSDTDLLNVINLNGTDAWDGLYYPGDWNSLEIKADEGVNLCVCGVTVAGSYYGLGEPLQQSDYPGSSGSLWWISLVVIFALLGVALIVGAGVLFFLAKRRKEQFEVVGFDEEFGDQ